ncbi:sensor histidine kinase [Dyadobacter psychrotolerans]|uniref:Histidine kinase n=1 Tax=Dyadobacter psychrotolerans TaxID=2541721 RepID=A0A4V2Z4J0_9BACT|nr:sensor histidine kinase [Dyadobacter psychrotolerans]TDE16848.1 histidine kinase [Dyadobacter psychrotolerans]
MSIPENNAKSEFWNFSPGFFLTNVLIAFLITFSFCPYCYFSQSGLEQIWQSFLISFFISVALSYGSSRLEHYFNKKLPWIHYPAKRLILQTLCYMIYSFCASYVLIVLFVLYIRQSYTIATLPWNELISDTQMPMKWALLISAILISRSFLIEWRKAAIEAEQLKTERYAQQYQSLKDQLNPHFLFNSLNVLSNLVYDNADTAAKFIRQLSKIYRYVLDVQQEELVSLERELEFAENYLALQKIRFEEGLQYSISVEKNESGFLPPLSLQLLLENAIKHNVASMANPLRIEIALEGNAVVVKNNLQIKSSLPEESAGVGLSNIRKRYELLSNENMKVEDENGSFVVRLPILRLNQQI